MIETRPSVSVVIPTFNRGETIRKAIDSALAQVGPTVEVIVVDDCSVDDTWGVIQSYGDRIRAVRQERNGGGGRARNTGIDLASGDYIAFLDCDDYWAEDKLARQIEALQDVDEDVVVYNRVCLVIGDRTRLTPTRAWTRDVSIDEYIVVQKQSMQTSGLLVSAPLAKRVRFDDDLRKYQDIDFAINLDRHGAKFVFCEAPTVFYENSTLASRVSTNPKPDLTQILLDKWGTSLSPNTIAYYQAAVMAPMYLRSSPPKAMSALARGFPRFLQFPKEVLEGFILWNFSEAFYNRLRQTYRKVSGKVS